VAASIACNYSSSPGLQLECPVSVQLIQYLRLFVTFNGEGSKVLEVHSESLERVLWSLKDTFHCLVGKYCTAFTTNITQSADPGHCTVYGAGLRPLACLDCEFESRRVHGCLSLVDVVCCQSSLQRADSSSRGVLLCVCAFVCVCH
jgi:hypothetical protein